MAVARLIDPFRLVLKRQVLNAIHDAPIVFYDDIVTEALVTRRACSAQIVCGVRPDCNRTSAMLMTRMTGR
jgi:hypothetical protein